MEWIDGEGDAFCDPLLGGCCRVQGGRSLALLMRLVVLRIFLRIWFVDGGESNVCCRRASSEGMCEVHKAVSDDAAASFRASNAWPSNDISLANSCQRHVMMHLLIPSSLHIHQID